MARGWESKDVESQMEEALEARRNSVARPGAKELLLARERDSILLQRSRVLADLKSATHAGYREILQRSLKFLDEKLAALEHAHPD